MSVCRGDGGGACHVSVFNFQDARSVVMVTTTHTPLPPHSEYGAVGFPIPTVDGVSLVDSAIQLGDVSHGSCLLVLAL